MFPIPGINRYRTELITVLHVQDILHAKYNIYLLFTF